MSSDNNFCRNCGTQLQAGALFCPRCGTAVAGGAAGQAPGPQQPSDWREQRRQWRAQRRAERYEKYEKQEKQEKHTEKEEKGRRGGIVGSVTGGAILIWLGITLYLGQAGYLSWSLWWAYFIAGIGVILIIQGLVSFAMYRIPVVGSLIGGIILILIGLFFISNLSYNFWNFWPLILVAIGVAILVSSLTARRRRPPPSPSPPP